MCRRQGAAGHHRERCHRGRRGRACEVAVDLLWELILLEVTCPGEEGGDGRVIVDGEAISRAKQEGGRRRGVTPCGQHRDM
jgi:hypothetical protein